MIILNNKEEIEKLIKENPMTIIYFTGNSCGACEIIKNKIEEILIGYPKVKSAYVDGEKHLDLAAKHEVFSLPVFLLFIEGKESIRRGKYVDLLQLEKIIKRYYDMIF